MIEIPQAHKGSRANAAVSRQVRMLVDGHVHIHPGHDEAKLLTQGLNNLCGHGAGIPVLLLAEIDGAGVFNRWRSGQCPWPVSRTDEPESVWLDSRLLVVAGQQIVTAERIEILALGTANSFRQGEPFEATLSRVEEAGAIPVLPWGVGKWMGPRGRAIAVGAERESVFLGDNAGRPFGWPKPRLFANHRVLAGTDPLRMKGEEGLVGTYGFSFSCVFEPRRPAESIRMTLSGLRVSPPALGCRIGPARFLLRQIALRLYR